MNDLHHYLVTVTWTGNNTADAGQPGPGTTGYADYSRAFELEAPGRHSIAGSSDPTFRGDAGRWNPEQLLVGSLSACHKLWFLHLAAVSGIVVLTYIDRAEGTMRTTPGAASGRFERVILRPEITLAPGCDVDLATSLHADAHRRCFISNSVNFAVYIEPSTRVAEPATSTIAGRSTTEPATPPPSQEQAELLATATTGVH